MSGFQTPQRATSPYTEEETGVTSGYYARKEAHRWRSTAQRVSLVAWRA